MTRFALVYGYGQFANGDIDGQSESRCRKALELYRGGSIDKICVTVGVEKNGILMGQKMQEYLLANGIAATDVVFLPRGFNTAGETDVSLRIIGSEDSVTAVSSWYHLPRIWFLWLVRGRLVSLASSSGGVHFGDLLIEPLKIANAVLRPFRSSKVQEPKPTV